jgi:hypothetical protein
MTKNALFLLALVSSLAAPACVITETPPRDVGSANADGSVYLGWNLIGRADKQTDHDEYLVGAGVGNFSAFRLHAEKPVALNEVLVIFADGTRWVAPAPQTMGVNETSQPIALPNGPRAIYSITITGAPTTDLLSRVDIDGFR